MCGRYTNTAGPEELNDRFKVPIPDGRGTRRFNIAPTEEVLTIVSPEGAHEAELLRWGLLTPWAKDLKEGAKLINARVETVAEKPSFRALIPKASRRALQLADGYFEWLKPERRGERRQPFHFKVDGGAPFAFASLWTPANVGGEWVQSVTLLTCDASANEVVGPIHSRMPVILADEEAWSAWLDPSVRTEEALSLCHPLPASRISAAPANPAVNRAGVEPEGPELLIAPQQESDSPNAPRH